MTKSKESAMSAYAELAVTTNFSFLHGASHAEELVGRAKELGLSGLGIADRNSVAGVVRAHDAAKEHGVRLAVGARLAFADGTPDILVYPRDRAAWGRLTRLLTVGKRRAEKGQCTLFVEDLLQHIEGQNLIVMGTSSAVAKDGATASSPAQPPNSGLPEFGYLKRPKSDKSDFGGRGTMRSMVEGALYPAVLRNSSAG